jgi:putative heme-binding domain-containing protein
MFRASVSQIVLLLLGVAAVHAAPSPDDVKQHREALRNYALEHTGSKEKGRSLFYSGTASCSTCHTVNCCGGKSGPDLSDLGAKYDRAEIITSVLDPSQRIAEGFQRVTITTVDGRTLRGRLLKEEPTFVEIRSGSHVVHVERTNIDTLELDPVSEMPEGLVDHLTPAQFADLIAFLESQKKPA